MQAILVALWNLVQPLAASVTSKLLASFTAIIGGFTNEERQALADAKTKFLSEYQSKGLEQAAADALTTFYDESKGAVNKASLHLFKAFLAAFGVPTS